MFEVTPLALAGLKTLTRPIARDVRGTFRKIVHAGAFAELGISADFPEQYVSTSAAGVVRGMHFQSPPHDHAKLVSVLAGRILDVVVDLRPGPDYGRHVAIELDATAGVSLFIPSGLAHGFLALEAACVLYDVGSVHAPAHDLGIAWDSFGFPWPVAAPILSDRDRLLPAFSDFTTPFAPSGRPTGAGGEPTQDRT